MVVSQSGWARVWGVGEEVGDALRLSAVASLHLAALVGHGEGSSPWLRVQLDGEGRGSLL